MKKLLLLGGILSFSLSFISCEDDETPIVDTEAPTIELEHPAYGERFAAGSTMEVHAELTDNVALATYNIDIHSNFDGHDHGRVAVSEFDYSQSFTATGTEYEAEVDIEIASDATAGPYHLILTAIDAAGNSTSYNDDSTVESEIWITNDEMALVVFTDAGGDEIDEYEAESDTELSFYGTITDQSGGLDHIEIVIGHHEEGDEHDHSHDRVAEGDEYLYDWDFEVEGQTEVTIESLIGEETITIPADEVAELEEGEHLALIVKVTDEDGNISEFDLELHFD